MTKPAATSATFCSRFDEATTADPLMGDGLN